MPSRNTYSRSVTVAPQIIDEAADWFIIMREPEVSAHEREAFADWMRASPQHVRAYLEIAGVWNDASRVGAEVCPADAIDEAGNVVPLNTATAPRAPEKSKRARWQRIGALAASVAIVCVTLASLAWWQLGRPDEYAAGVGEQRVITLEDGSVVRINSRSRVRVRMSAAQRDVDLLAGQALFEVAKDPARPFLVHSGSISVRAVGTAFDVYRKPDGTVVTVVEGRVMVQSGDESGAPPDVPAGVGAPSPTLPRVAGEGEEREARTDVTDTTHSSLPRIAGEREEGDERTDDEGTAHSPLPRIAGEGREGATRSSTARLIQPRSATHAAGTSTPTARSIFLSAGEQVTMNRAGVIEHLPEANVTAATSWLNRELIFEGRPLGEVVEEFNRYSRRTLVVSDPEIAALRINGVFHTTSPDALLRFVEQLDGVSVAHSDSRILISSRTPSD